MAHLIMVQQTDEIVVLLIRHDGDPLRHVHVWRSDEILKAIQCYVRRVEWISIDA